MRVLKFGMRFCIGLLFCAPVGIIAASKFACADDVYQFVIKKQEDKSKNRWSLSDWLATRDQMRLHDLWLAMHSPSPFEYYLSANIQFNQTTPTTYFNAFEMAAAAYVAVFGIEGRVESGNELRYTGLFGLRIFGYHDQATHIMLQGGLRSRTISGDSIRSPVFGGKISLYLAKPFGLQFQFLHFFPSSPLANGQTGFGDRMQGGAFLEFTFARLYGSYFSEADSIAPTTGTVLGLQLYF